MEEIKALKRKRQGADTETTNEADVFDVAVDDEISSSQPSRRDRQGPNKRQRMRNSASVVRSGLRRVAMSSGDLRGFSSKKMKDVGKQRPGKARRAGKR